MKTIKEQIKSLFNGVVSIEKYNDCYIVSTKKCICHKQYIKPDKRRIKVQRHPNRN